MEIIEQAKDFLKLCDESEIRRTNSAIDLLNETKLDQASIIAACLYMPFSDEKISKEEIVEKFGEEVFNMLHGLIELHKVQYNNEEEEAENIRKMYFALAKDFRIIFIKLAFVVAQMRNQDLYSQEELKALAKLNLDLFAPLAARLGLSKIKSELEDCSFKILHPQKYRDIETAVENKYILAQSMIEKIRQNLRQILGELEIHGEIMGRRKHAYSIYKKLISKHENIDDIYDLVALRVLVDTLPECYAVLGKVHQLFTPIRGRFKDYIATPKSNGYQSLHTTILFEGLPVEIQVRTFDMHRSAEYGYAAHWMYKEKRSKQDSLDEKLGWIRQILEENDNLTSKEMIDSLKVDIYDATAGSAKRVLFATEDWKVEQPILAFTDVVDLKYNNPALATNDQIKIIDLINALNVKATEASYKKWTNLTLKDAVGNTLVKYDVTKIAAEETIAETLYRKNAAGNAVAEATGLEISLDENETDFTYDAATATLTWKGTPEGTVYTHDVNLNITYTHNWGVVTKTFKVTVTRKVK